MLPITSCKCVHGQYNFKGEAKVDRHTKYWTYFEALAEQCGSHSGMDRNPVRRFRPKCFYFHFKNCPDHGGRNGCYLCYEVKRTQRGLPLDVGTGVFENEPRGSLSPLRLSQFYPKKPKHTEICFLNWFKTQPAFLAQNLSREEKYHVTWFMSWSPCFQCARQVVEFLKDHEYVQLSIFVARLYYSSRPEYQQGLRSLQGAGAQVAIMTPDDFAYCRKVFVHDPHKPFRYWKGIYINSCSLSKTLEDILRKEGGGLSVLIKLWSMTRAREGARALLRPRAGQHQRASVFGSGALTLNRTTVDAQPPVLSHACSVTCLLCHMPALSHACFVTRVPPPLSLHLSQLHPGHAELCFLDWFREKVLFPDEIRCPDAQYHVTWYISWSPCFECAEQVADFLNENENVDLSISAARLYLCEDEDEQGLQDLVATGAKVAMMAPEDFEYCWDNFVYNGGWHFTYWKNVRRNYRSLQQQLNKILWDLRRIHDFIFGTE
ncbi:PREDICTED: DNA dC-_dU-editing enzyme APOBEC-3D-like [Myotis brandtii]|uniref:DNA dC->dU-editing enzyme APOBEC-3D-like n=1 Tax=Myotis brandtii TaxID=109478 RepID=UPI000703EDFF|nr:PREDICTED: DNA dC->dU-editing enzyme APOBEC-3D-like [Myotis brandtii]